MATVVSIGRGTKDNDVLSDVRWGDFKSRTIASVRAYADEVYFFGEGQGWYEGEREEAFTVVGSDVTDGWLRKKFEARLELLARDFRQDAVAVTYGETTFVTVTSPYESALD